MVGKCEGFGCVPMQNEVLGKCKIVSKPTHGVTRGDLGATCAKGASGFNGKIWIECRLATRESKKSSDSHSFIVQLVSPCTEILGECGGSPKHVRKLNIAVKRPRAQILVESSGIHKHLIHAQHARDFPRRQGLVEVWVVAELYM